ncbi:MAG: hypothetical protein ACK4ND_00665 [Cytophagaceae bacterium]
MKMAVFSSAIFWGTLLILAGISIILKVGFGINFPFFRILFAFFLIFMGIKVLTGISFKSSPKEQSTVFGSSSMRYNPDNPEMNVIFGKGELYFTDVEVSKNLHGKVNVVFGNAELFIDEEIPMKIKATTVFGGTNFPDETTIAFGDYIYKTKAFEEGKPFIHLKTDVIFGGLQIKNR